MSGLVSGLGSVSGIVAFLNKLIDFFKTTEVEKVDDSNKKVSDEDQKLKDGSRPKWD